MRIYINNPEVQYKKTIEIQLKKGTHMPFYLPLKDQHSFMSLWMIYKGGSFSFKVVLV